MPDSQPLRTDRYKAAYGVARMGITAGKTVRILAAIVFAAIVLLTALVAAGAGIGFAGAAQQMAQTAGADSTAGPALVAVIVGLLGFGFAVLACAPAYLLGILIESTSEVLLATLDTAVNTSPFLAEEQKLGIMRL